MWCTHRPNSHCKFILIYKGGLIHKETWSAASFGWAEGLQTINPPIYRLTTAVSDIDQTNINRDIRDGNWLSSHGLQVSGQPCLLTPDWDTIPILELVNKIADVVKEERYYIVTDCFANRRSLGELKERLREEHDNQNSQNFPYFKGSLSFRLVQGLFPV